MISDEFFLKLSSSLSPIGEPAVIEVQRPINPAFNNEWIVYYKWSTKAAKLRISFAKVCPTTKGSYNDSPVAEIRYFRMSPQGHGYGTILMQNLLLNLSLEGIQSVILVPKNERAAAFWHKLGFNEAIVSLYNYEATYALHLPYCFH